MQPEIITLTVAGVPIRAHLDHADALALIKRAGVDPAPIPAGRNTVLQDLTLATGEPALAICQRGIPPNARDDERQVNGWTLLVLIDPAWSPADARAVLAAARKRIIGE